jgi:hypothetical protein
MSKLGTQVMEVLRETPSTVLELAARLDRPESSVKTMLNDLRRSGYVKNLDKSVYPALYAPTRKAGPVVIDWKPRLPKAVPPPTMVQNTIRTVPNSVFALGVMA